MKNLLSEISTFPLIALAEYSSPLFHLVTIRKVDEIFTLIKEEGLFGGIFQSEVPCSVENGQGYKSLPITKLENKIFNKYFSEQFNLLVSLDNEFLLNPLEITEVRSKFNIPKAPPLDYFHQLCSNDRQHKGFYIDS